MSSELIIKLDAEGEGEVIEYSVAIGDTINEGDSLLVVESDKASMDIPATRSGVVSKWLVEIGSNVSQGAELAMITAAQTSTQQDTIKAAAERAEIAAPEESTVATVQQVADSASNDAVGSREIIISLDAEGAGEVVEYSAAIGDSLSEGQALLLVESDKAAMDIPTSSAGILTKWLVQIGDQVSQGQQLAIITVTAEQTSIAARVTAAAVPVTEVPETSETSVTPQQKTVIATTTPVASINSSISAGPAARKLAREMAVDLSRVTGSTYRGRILKEDIKAFVKQQMLSVPSNTAVASAPFDEIDFSQFGDIETKKMSGMARATSAHMTRCWLNIPHVTLSDEVDITELEAFRASFKPEEFQLLKKPTILPFIIMIIAKALRKFPQFNCSIHPDGQQIIYKQYINIGIAVDTPAGLLVPVIRDADKMSISELVQQVNNLADRAKNRKLSAADMSGGCFSISSLGPIGGTGFTPIINGPEVAILGVASAETKPVWDGQSFIPRKKLPLCLSFDHRVINGADAGKFLGMVRQYMEQIGKIIL
ncbi:MAG: 2-oxo acid dehydrogenase subunit E2 [Pseudomonadales bacterium]|nr:2-oxo acid dehydrogenase subunit E2 [Pseudomonadales bacterium]NRA15959.1 2-oxo acid dehydrogenase subunit E2 [Oceanospirillaceae bacterium]